MKYQIKGVGSKRDDDFEVIEVKVIKERTRAKIATWTVGLWLSVVLISAAEAALTGHRDDLHYILTTVTQLVSLAFAFYLGQTTSK